MSGAAIGFYVHHQGTGHLRRAAAIVEHLQRPATVLTGAAVDASLFPSSTEIIALPPDDEAGRVVVDPTAGGALHWAPLAPDLLQPRAARMVEWLTRPSSRVLVCDVSVEAALLARLCGVAPILVHQTGVRHDPPHRLGDAVAVARLCPYPEELESDEVGADERQGSFYAGVLGRSRQPLPSTEARRRIGAGSGPLAVVVVGGGGHSFDPGVLPAVADAMPGWSVRVAGPFTPCAGDGRWRVDGWVDDLWPHLCAADVVMATGGSNVVAEVAGAGRPLVCVPEERPFAEQEVRASRLDAIGLAVTAPGWPEPSAWPGLIERARDVGGDGWERLIDPTASARTAAWIETIADGSVAPC